MLGSLLEAGSEANRTLLGSMLIKFGASLIAVWGTTNAYYYSLFRSQGTPITSTTNAIITLMVLGPASLSILASKPIANRFGHLRTVRACSLWFFLGPLPLLVRFDLYTMIIFGVFIPAICFGLTSMALLHIVWENYASSHGLVGGLLVVAYSSGTILWNLLFMYAVNPSNATAIIDSDNGAFFDESVYSRIPFATSLAYGIAGLLILAGSMLIRKRCQPLQRVQCMINAEINMKADQDSPYSINDQIELATDQINKADKQSNSDQRLSQMQSITQKNKKDINNDSKSMMGGQNDRRAASLIKYITQTRFLAIMGISFLVNLFQIFVSNNLKQLYIPVVNDDHFLGYCSMASTIMGILGAYIWGLVGDKLGFRRGLAVMIALDSLAKMTMLAANDRMTLVAGFLLLGLVDKGMIVLVGPGLIELYGLALATDLLPYKSVSFMVGLAFVPLVQIGLIKRIGMFGILAVLAVVNILAALILSIFWNKFAGSAKSSHVPSQLKTVQLTPQPILTKDQQSGKLH